MSRVRAAASSWKRVAEEARTSVWPIRWWACTSCQPSGYTRAASFLANTRSPTALTSSRCWPSSPLRPMATSFSKSSSVSMPLMAIAVVRIASSGLTFPLRIRSR